MKTGLVLGGGGLVGMAYHAGVLKALDETGIDPAAADLIVGTSAGSIIGSYLASGWATSDFYEFAHGRHRDSLEGPDAQRAETKALFIPMWESRQERLRRGIGGAFTLAASRGYWKLPTPPAALRRAFPSGAYSTDVTRDRLQRDLPAQWPNRRIYICAAELYTGRRVAFGKSGAPPAELPEAVLASTSIPAFFPPVRIGGRQYVDGGVVSATSLDLATSDGCDKILCIAPLGYLRAEGMLDPRALIPMAMRSMFARSLRREVNEARDQGADVFVIRPWVSDLVAHGTNSMRRIDRARLAESARLGTLQLLEQHADNPVLKAFSTAKKRKKTG